MSLDLVIALIDSTLRLGTPIALTALGELVAERSGVVNIGIEGIMVIGAFVSVVATFFTGNPFVGVAAGILVGILLGLLHGAMSIYLYADQIVIGMGVIFLGYGITAVGNAVIWGQPGFSVGVPTVPHLVIPIAGVSMSLSPILFLTIAIALALRYVLNHTWLGLRLRSVGENPEAADALGVNVFRTRLLATVFGGALAGLAGAYLGVDWGGRFVSYMSAGRGFIALASIIVGGWQPMATLLAGYLFGVFDAIQLTLAQIYGKQVPPQFFQMIPYIATIVVFTLFFRRARPPEAIAKPYRRE
ncbi:MAG: ABC transporter permease [Thermoprotei archaeon]|nr:MAG: ABC transporter permease [Thermoprotei archaeon]